MNKIERKIDDICDELGRLAELYGKSNKMDQLENIEQAYHYLQLAKLEQIKKPAK